MRREGGFKIRFYLIKCNAVQDYGNCSSSSFQNIPKSMRSSLFVCFEFVFDSLLSLISNFNRFTRCILGPSFPQDLPSIFPHFECFEFEFSFHSISFPTFNRSKHQCYFVRIDETPLQKVDLEAFLNCSKEENQNSKKLRFLFHFPLSSLLVENSLISFFDSKKI